LRSKKKYNYVLIYATQCVNCKYYQDLDCELNIVNNKYEDIKCANFEKEDGGVNE
jgi:hypothetical protein